METEKYDLFSIYSWSNWLETNPAGQELNW
jgi:hypothetical protein